MTITRFPRRMVQFAVLLAMLAGLAACRIAGQVPAYELVRAPQAGDAMPVYVYQLSNGLTVYLTENHQEPRFYAEIAVRTGSKMDPQDTTGLAHYLEHLLFKGTDRLGTLDYAAEKPHLDRIQDLYEQHFREQDPEKRKAIYAEIDKEAQLAAAYAVPNEMDTLYKSMGAKSFNAHTWREETIYEVDLPSNRLKQWAQMEVERFRNPVFRLFHTELETVYEEKNRSLDDGDRIIFDAVNRQLFKKHSYGKTTLGDVEHLKRPSLVAIRDYYDKWYVPNNMAICISGDISIDGTIKLIAKNFGTMHSKPVPKMQPVGEEPLKGTEAVTAHYPGEEEVMLAFRTAPRGSADDEALRMLDMILDNANAGLINLNLNEAQLVRRAGSYPMLDNDYGTEILWGVPKAGQTLEEVQKLLLDQIEILKKGEFEDWIIPAIVNDFKKTQAGRLEENGGRVSMMSQSFIALESWDKAAHEIQRFEKVTREDVIRVANAYFSGGHVAGFRRDGKNEIPQIDKPKISALKLDSTKQSEFGKAISAIPVTPIQPYYIEPGRDYVKSGEKTMRTFYYAENPLNNLFTLQLVIAKGSDHDARLPLASRLLDRCGTAKLSAEELKKEWYKLGTDMGVGVGPSDTAITISGLDENLAASLDLLRQLLAEPTPGEGTFDELKKIVLAERADEKKDPDAIFRALYLYNRLGDDSPILRRLTDAEVTAAPEKELLGLMSELPNYRQTLTYVGSLPPARVQALVADAFPLPEKPIEPPAYVRHPIRKALANELYFIDKEMTQANVRIESAGDPVSEERTPAIMMYNNYFAGGLSGIVYQELRESRGLVYSAGARYAPGERTSDEDLMLGALGCQADKAVEATKALLDVTENLAVEQDRFAGTIESLDGRFRTEKLTFREVIGAVRAWEFLGLKPDPRLKQFEAIQRATIEDMLSFQKHHVASRPRLISVVGDRKRIDMENLEKIAKFEEIPVDRVFQK